MNRHEFLEILFNSHGVVIDWDNKEHTFKDLMDRANKNKHNKVVLTQQERPEELFVEYMSAVLGGGTLVLSKTKPKTKPQGDYVSFTSGTTGEPKAIVHTLENFIAPATGLVSRTNFNNRSVYVNHFPVATNAVIGAALFPVALSESKLVLKKFNPFKMVAELNELMPTHVTILPRMYTAIRNTKGWDSCDLSNAETVITGASSPIHGFFDAIRNRGGRPHNCYGTTEMPAIMNANPESETHLGHHWFPGAEWKVDDGELCIRWNHLDWQHTGDMVEVDSVLGPKIIGRKDNQFKYRDFRVVPESYETIAKQHNQVNDALLRLEDHLVLYYEGDATAADLESMLLKYNDKEMMPRRIVRVQALPRTPLGKVARKGEVIL